MAKVMWMEDEQFDQSRSSRPGCMSGVFHALDYNYWHSNVKKILPHRKHEAIIKHAERNRRYQRISDDQDSYEVLRLLDAKTSHIEMDRRNRKTSSTQKRSLRARIKALVSEENYNKQDQDFVPSPKLQRTYSIHHLESNEWVHPIIFFPENVAESPVSSKPHPNGTDPEVNNSQDILDMFEVDKELFNNTAEDCSQAFVIKQKLIKSGSFPTAFKSDSRSLMPMKLKDKLNEIYTVSKAEKTKILNEDVNGNSVIRLRRISSLNEPADRYTQLFDFSIGKEALLRTSRSLKLTNGSESILSTQQPSSFRRNNLNQESYERNPISLPKDKYAELNSPQDCKSLNEVTEKDDTFSENEDSPEAKSIASGKNSHALEIKDDSPWNVQETAKQCPVLVPDYCPSDEKVETSEGLDLLSIPHENLKKETNTVNMSKKDMDLSMKDDDFTYVKKILQRSGFLKNGFQQTWYSSIQPLDPFVFQEFESQYLHDPERFAEEMNELSHRLLIFDLVDEVLFTMNERSSTSYQKKLSSFYHIRPTPTGSLVLNEVWNRVSQLINLKHDMNESLNDIVARDLRSDDGWMNLQLDLECVELDLEDLILDEVLEELLFEFI